MPKVIRNALTTKKIEALKAPGEYADGDGLFLRIAPGGSKQWVFRYVFDGSRRKMGLGGFTHDNGIAIARQNAGECRELLAKNQDPIQSRVIAEAGGRAQRADMPTFDIFATQMVESWAPTFRNSKHTDQWRSTVTLYCKKWKGVPIDQIDTSMVVTLLKPLWKRVPVTAKRVQLRLKRFFDAAKVAGHRQGENPARWDGHLKLLLPDPNKFEKNHHHAIPYAEIPAFVYELWTMERVVVAGGSGPKSPAGHRVVMRSMSSLAAEFTLLTAVRTAASRLAKLGEFDFDKKIWTVPKARTKTKKADFRVPLTQRAIDIVNACTAGINDPGAYVFRGKNGSDALSNMAMLMCIQGLEKDATVHGFRSSFRDYIGEETEYAREVAEAALEHTIGTEAERAYRRGDALERRRHVMQAWSDYVYSDDRMIKLLAG